MKEKEPSTPPGTNRVDGAAAAWGVPNLLDASEIQARSRRFQEFAAEVNAVAGEAVSNHAQALSAMNERVAEAFQDLMSARQAPELLAAQSSLIEGLMNGMTAHAKVWTEQAQKLNDCCAAMIRDGAAQAGDRSAAAPQSTSKPSAGRSASRDAGKRPASD